MNMWGILVMKYAGSLGQFMNEYVKDFGYEIYWKFKPVHEWICEGF